MSARDKLTEIGDSTPLAQQLRLELADLAKRELVELGDLSATFQDRDELVGHEHGAVGVDPARERLGARDLAARRPELGLEPDLNLARGKRVCEAALDELLPLHAVDDLLVELDVVDVVFRAYRRKRVLGLLDDLLDVHAAARRHVHRPLERGAPDAGALLQVARERHAPRLADLGIHRLAEAAEHPRAQIHQAGEVVSVRFEQPGDLHEQTVDRGTAVLPVELLEVVDLEKAEVEVAIWVVAPYLLTVDEERLLGVQAGQKVGLDKREIALELGFLLRDAHALVFIADTDGDPPNRAFAADAHEFGVVVVQLPDLPRHG